jgi:hypothetical protein
MARGVRASGGHRVLTVRLKGRRERGYTVPYIEGGPEIGGRLLQRILYEDAPGSLLRRLFCLDTPCGCMRCSRTENELGDPRYGAGAG